MSHLLINIVKQIWTMKRNTKMRPFIFELKLRWIGFYGNLLEWIPSIYVFISDNPSIKLKWMGIEISLWCGLLGNVGKGFYLTPNLVFKHLNKEYKEKYDFQFSWLGINYRKFIGERVKYKTILAEELKKRQLINRFNLWQQ